MVTEQKASDNNNTLSSLQTVSLGSHAVLTSPQRSLSIAHCRIMNGRPWSVRQLRLTHL
ncbi:hypothetical protein BDW72DRAFT_174290, partial [Aspergillus terricola var. indicus]